MWACWRGAWSIHDTSRQHAAAADVGNRYWHVSARCGRVARTRQPPRKGARMRTGLAAVVAVGALAAVPSAAAARTYSAYAGNPGKVPSSAPPSTQLNKFFPATLKVRAGDKVKYASGFIHTASVLGR